MALQNHAYAFYVNTRIPPGQTMKPTWNNFTCRTYKKAGDPQAGTEPASELLRLFIQKIVVHEKSTKWSKKAM